MPLRIGNLHLPVELLMHVVYNLNFEDFVNLQMASSDLFRVLSNESLNREMAKRLIPHSKETVRADQHSSSYAMAVQRTFWRREAFALGRPHSALILGHGTSLAYRDGILCYVDGSDIRILDIHHTASVETAIDLDLIARPIWKRPRRCVRADLLHYQDGMLSLVYYTSTVSEEQPDDGGEGWLIAVNIGEGIAMSQRVRLAIVLHHSKYWVRNDARRLYVGYHDGVGDHGHHEWVVQGYDLMTGKPSASLQLHDFPGTDLRQTVVFEIYGDYLYALSNQSSFEVEEIDWTSYYHCYRFPVLDPVVPRLQCQRIWRRQHRDGPINDSWTELGLHQDERTGTLHITECRREWKDGLSAQKRTYYSEPLIFAEQDLDADPTGTSAIPQRSESPSPPCSASATATQYPFNDPLYKAVTEENKPSYSEPKPRIPRNYHPEYSTTEAPRETTFLLAKTKYRTSIPSSDAFLDLVLDNYPSPGIRSPIPPRCWQQQIRLRIGSRAQAPPDDHTTGLLYPRTVDADGVPIPGSEERFRDRGITLWPPADAPVELLDLLNPEIVPGSASRLLGDVTAVTDERSLIYMAAPLFRQGGSRNIVLVNFDRWIRFPDLPRIVCEIDPEEPGRHVVMKRDVEARSGKGKKRERSDDDAEMGREEGKRWKTDDDRREWWSLERARHLDIGRGFQFEYKEKAKPRVSS